MIRYKLDNSISVLPSIAFSSIIILCCVISLLSNPVVFFFNRKRKSVAAFLFTLLSIIDFLFCFTFPFVVLLQASDIPKLGEGRQCFGISDEEYWNCIYLASTGQKVSTAVLLCLDSAAVSTTSLLAITRYIQLKNPLVRVRKRRVALAIASVFIVAVCLHLFSIFGSHHDTFYSVMVMLVMHIDPYDFGLAWQNQYLSGVMSHHTGQILILMTNLGTLVLQLGALISALLTAYFLFNKKESNISGSNVRRKRGSLKILLTNLPSFLILFRIMLEAPLMSIARQSGLYTEFQGWIIFSLHRMLPLLASTWNPVIFISLTPKTRKLLRNPVSSLRLGPWLSEW